MIHNASFRRKVIYLGLIALLLIPLYVVGHPAVGDPADKQSSPGGRLAQLRAEYDLSPAQLGEIDPTSESMKLATLGMRGIAANILWTKANDYKMKENWEGLVAVVNQMARLQPNFISVWEFQSHNLSYNISVEQDDYRFRYLWVKKGIEFLMQGTKYNRREPRLYWTLGWYTGQKFGRADEHKQFRRLYRTDSDFHDLQSEHVDIYGDAGGPDGKPDTWLTSRLWFNRAYSLVDTQGRPIRGKSPHIFYADGPKARMNYSVTIEEEGYLDEKAEVAWKKSGDEWHELGNRTVPTTWGPTIRLNDEEKLLADAKQIAVKLDELAPGVRQRLHDERIAALPKKERDALQLTDEQIPDEATYYAREEGRAKSTVTHRDVAQNAPEDVKAAAFRLAQQAMEAETVANYVDRYRQNVAFEYWRTRCQVEQLHDTVQARKHIYAAEQLVIAVEYNNALAEYQKAWDLWGKIMEENPGLLDQLTSDDLMDHFRKYADLVAQLEIEIPADFRLRPLLEKNAPDEAIHRLFAPAAAKPADDKPADDKPADDKPADDKPADDKPADDKPADDKPADDKPADDKPADDKPADDKPADDKPADDKPADDKPADDKPANDKPADDKPADDKPADDKPADDKPADDKPADDKPAA